MKRLLSLAGFVIILSLVPLTSVWAVWEGNAGIGAASDFPGSGLYARSDMFPKNTVVEIKNLETEKTVRAVITGASGVPGLVAVLSPETASALSIKAGSVCRVRIFIPTVTERPADGTIVDSTKPTNADPDANPAAAVTQSKDSEVPLETIAETQKDPLVALAPAPAESATPSAAARASSTQPAAEQAAPSSIPAAGENPASAAPAAAVAAVPDAADTESPSSGSAETAPATGEDSPSVVESAGPTDSVAAAPASSSSPMAEPELAVAPASSSEVESDVSLVPAEPLPPMASSGSKTDVPVVDAPVPVPPANASASAAITEVSPAEQPAKTVQSTPTAPVAASPAPATPTASVVGVAPVSEVQQPRQSSSDASIVSSLAKGSYYIQIGTYGDMSNVKKIVDKYGSKYPFTVEKGMAKGTETLKVYVGPVKKDEYGAVLERFHQLGFKDAFVKKGQ